MATKYFKMYARYMQSFGINRDVVFPVKEVETNMIGGKGWDAFVTLDTPAMLDDCYIGTNLVVRVGKGEFVDAPEPAITPAEKSPLAPAMHLWEVVYIIGNIEKTVVLMAPNRSIAQAKAAATEPDECTIFIQSTTQYDGIVFLMNEKQSKHITN